MSNLTPHNEANAREIEMMVGKAMCAWANWMDIADNRKKYESEYGSTMTEVEKTAAMSEYEATVRCIAMFTEERLPQVCEYVIERAKAEFGI